MITIKPVQTECINAIWKELVVSDDMIVQLPTGTGKTIIFVKLLELLLGKYPELKALVLVNKIKLVEQTKEKLMYMIGEDKIGLYCGSLGEKQNKMSITVGSIQSISMITEVYNILIIDECHNAENSATYTTYIDRLRKANPKLKIVRFTATPYTMNGYIYGQDKPIKKLTFKKTLNQMIAEGNLVRPEFKSVKGSFDTSQLRKKRGEFIMADVEKMSKDQKKVETQVADAIPRLNNAGRKKVVWAATCIAHAKILKEELERYEACSIVHSELSDKERARNLSDFENGDTRHLISIMIVTEGYDYPPIDAIVNMRPTRSPVLYVQLIGRALRLCEGKDYALILDYGEAVEYFGHPSDPFIPGTGKKNNPAEKKCIICPACDTINFLPRRECTSCSYQFLQADSKPTTQKTKALTNEAADVELNANGFPEMILNVILCNVNNDYLTKSDGRPCIKVVYTTMMGPVTEYIKKETHFHREWNKDLLKYRSTPKKILVEKKGKYYNIVKRVYE